MPAPDICYFLEGSVSLGHIGPDTYHYFMEMDPETNAVVDGYSDPPAANFDRHMNRLEDMGLFLEHRYVGYRDKDPVRARWASVGSLMVWPEIVSNYIHEMALGAVNDGHTTVNAEVASEHAKTMQILRRSMHRAKSDLSGVTRQDIVAIMGQRRTHLARRYREVLDDVDRFYNENQTVAAESFIKAEKKRARNVIKRSVKFLSSLIGDDQTRMFVSGDRIRIEGEHCVYEIHRSGRMALAHGGSGLSVYTKGEDIHLCDICIYTQGVPILDHIASIIMHIRAGEEEQILKVGNPYNVTAPAREQAWLVPYLPPPPVKHNNIPTLDGLIRLNGDTLKGPKDKTKWRAAVSKMRRQTARFLYEEISLGDVAPLMKLVHQCSEDW